MTMTLHPDAHKQPSSFAFADFSSSSELGHCWKLKRCCLPTRTVANLYFVRELTLSDSPFVSDLIELTLQEHGC